MKCEVPDLNRSLRETRGREILELIFRDVLGFACLVNEVSVRSFCRRPGRCRSVGRRLAVVRELRFPCDQPSGCGCARRLVAVALCNAARGEDEARGSKMRFNPKNMGGLKFSDLEVEVFANRRCTVNRYTLF